MSTKFDQLDSPLGHVKLVTTLPSTPTEYYGVGFEITSSEWRGGEIVYHKGAGTGGNKLYIQTEISGTTPTWKVVSTQFTTYSP